MGSLLAVGKHDDNTWEAPIIFRDAPGSQESNTALAYISEKPKFLVIFGGVYRRIFGYWLGLELLENQRKSTRRAISPFHKFSSIESRQSLLQKLL
jgi:hypothetical protein